MDKIHACGMKAGVSIKPNTPVSALEPVLDKTEMFLIMSVEPGFGGQAFIPESLDKIRELKNLLDTRRFRRILRWTEESTTAMSKKFWMRERM